MSYIPEPVTRTDKYLAYIAGNMDVTLPNHPITRKEHYLAAWAEKSGFEDVDVTGEPPLTLENAIGKPLKGLRIYGKSKQVMTTGAQLISAKTDATEINGITYSSEYGKITLDGTASADTTISIPSAVKLEEGKTYTISSTSLVGVNNVAIYSSIITLDSTAKTAMATGTGTPGILIYIASGTTYHNDELRVMVEEGSTAHPYEPYTGGKPSPSPDYPQEIESVGQDGEIGVEVYGRNLFDKSAAHNFTKSGGWSAGLEGEEIKVLADNATIGSIALFRCEKTLPAGTYTFSISKPLPFRIRIDNYIAIKKGDTSATATFNNDISITHFAGDVEPGTSFNELRFKIMLNIGSTALPYESYHEPKSMDISTPNGLPGILVSSGGNYTDASGRQWICDEVDFGRGVYVQRCWKGEFDGSDDERWEIYNNTTYAGFYLTNVFAEKLTMRDGIANTYKVDNSYIPIEAAWIGVNEKAIYIKNSRFYDDTLSDKGLSNFKDSLAAHPMVVMTYLDSPIETPLTSDQLAAYKQLHTYKGTTIIDNDAGAYMSVKYEKMK